MQVLTFLDTFFEHGQDKYYSDVNEHQTMGYISSVIVEINQLPPKKMRVHDWAASKPLIPKNNQLLE